MTMSNQMALSAASVAVLANNNTLVNMGAMQNADYVLDGSTINAGLEATKSQATADQKSIIDSAETARINAGCQMGGAIAGAIVTGTGFGMGTSLNRQAEALDSSTPKAEIGLSTVETTSSASASTLPAGSTAASSVANITGEIDPAAPAPAAKITGMLGDNDQENSAINAKEADATAITKKAETETNPNAEAVKALRSRAENYMQTGSAFGNLLNSAISSGGGIGSYSTTVDQASQTQIKDLEAGLASALNTQTSLIGSQLSNLDSMRSNTYQLMSSLQHIQG